MSKFFYPKLAITNLKKNSQTYLPYILTCIGIIIMFYNMCGLTFNSTTTDSESLTSIMTLGTFVVGIFAVIFLFYTNSFLVKRRKKEFGLFNLLGMEKKHIGKIMLWENIFVGGISIPIGIGLGIIFSKLISLLLAKMIKFETQYDFEISWIAIGITALLFILIFLAVLINNLIQVYTVKTIELLRGSNVGEREPKTKWLLAIIGVVLIGIGYYISITKEDPLASIGVFMYAALFVIIGTYCLFTAGSIALLKSLKKKKSLYYQTKYFTSISGMIYRMKQNAVGLSNICIMSTIVLVLTSTTISMYVGIDDILDKSFPEDISITARYFPDVKIDNDSLNNKIKEIAKKNNIEISNYAETLNLDYGCNREGNKYISSDNAYVSIHNLSVISFITAEEYEKITGKVINLNDDEILFYNKDETIGNVVNILDNDYKIKERLNETPVAIQAEYEMWKADFSCVVLANNKVLSKIAKELTDTIGDYAGKASYNISFDINKGNEEEVEFTKVLETELGKNDFGNPEPFNITSKASRAPEFYELYGSLFFLGIFLGGLFLMGTVLIIYYKQVIEGYEDKERFKIMQNVGMSKEEVKRTIKSQVLTVFALPIVIAVIHILAAFPIMTKMLALLSLTNEALFALCTVITVFIFIVIYVIVYALTARIYYKIVN